MPPPARTTTRPMPPSARPAPLRTRRPRPGRGATPPPRTVPETGTVSGRRRPRRRPPRPPARCSTRRSSRSRGGCG
ncbi:hypothetical protein CEP81_00965 [Kocuria rhizophila]|nr:hypothetical protein CEP81_00965 [Kocuria rhizophila]